MKLRVRYIFLVSCLLIFLVALFFLNPESATCRDCNVVLISVDTLGSDHMGLYEYFRNTTPFLDSFSKNGLIFENSYSADSYTLPSHMSIFTSLYPSEHLVGKNNFNFTLNPNDTTLTEILKSHGYSTGAIVSLPYLSSYYGYSRGFDFYNEDALQNTSDRKADVINQAAFNWVQQNEGKKFFLFLHYSEVHSRWLLPKEYYNLYNPESSEMWNTSSDELDKLNLTQDQLKNPVAIYDGSVNFIDKTIGNVVDFLQQKNLAGKTIIIITADHGEEFDEHGRIGHGHGVYQEVIRVPLIIVYPHGKRGVVQDFASGIDIAPTVLNLLGLPVPPQFEGQSLINPHRNFVISEYNSLATLIQNNSKIIVNSDNSGIEFYNLSSDPKELASINDSKLYVQYDSFLSGKMQNFEQQSKIYGGMPDAKNFDASLIKHLRELGYV